MSRSDPAAAQLSTYVFPEELRVDELLIRAPTEADVDALAPAFRDPDVGGEAGLPPFDAEMLRTVLRDQLPEMLARGLLAPYVIVDTRTDEVLGGMALHHFDSMRDVIEVGSWLFASARGRGVARLRYCLRRHGLVRGSATRSMAWRSAAADPVHSSGA